MDKNSFFKHYGNLPISVRREIVLDLGEKDESQPVSWEVAFHEIRGNTELGNKILEKLIELKFIRQKHERETMHIIPRAGSNNGDWKQLVVVVYFILVPGHHAKGG